MTILTEQQKKYLLQCAPSLINEIVSSIGKETKQFRILLFFFEFWQQKKFKN